MKRVLAVLLAVPVVSVAIWTGIEWAQRWHERRIYAWMDRKERERLDRVMAFRKMNGWYVQ